MVIVKMITILLIFIYFSNAFSYGYDSGSDQAACGKPRTGREFIPPCDLNRESYCITAGTGYPWKAVKRFVGENQGLMKRMYGDQSHIAVLQGELDNGVEDNEVHEKYINPNNFIRKEWYRTDEKDETSPRLLNDDPKFGELLNAKFIYSEQGTYKTKLYMPHFRPVTTPRAADLEFRNQTTNVNSNMNTNTVPYENTTDSMENATETVTTEESTTEYLTSTEKVTEEMTTEPVQKRKTVTGEVLFQDMEEPSKKTTDEINFKLKGVNACPVKEEVVAPFWANNTRGEVLALLNLYPFEQYVHWEKCTYEHRQMYCREGCRCEQQYRLHRLLAYDPNNECRGIFSDWFRFPSCCVCKCYNIPDFRVTSRSPRSRFGENDINDMPSWIFAKSQSLFDDG